VAQTKYIFILLTFCATVSQGLWVKWLQNEGILVVDIPLVLLYIFGRSKMKQAPYTIPALVLVIVFFLWSNIGLFFAPNKLYFRQEGIENIRALLIFLSIILFVNNKQDLQYIFVGFAAGLTFQGLIAMHQWLRGPVGLTFLGEHVLGWQAQGTFVHPSVFGMYSALLSILTYRVAVFLRPKYHQFFVFAFFIGVVGLYASFNRATWLAFAISMSIMFVVDLFRGLLFKKRSRKLILIILVVALAGFIRYGNLIIERFSDSKESLMANRSSSRKSLALDAIRIIKAHPVLGVGLNNYREYVNPETAGTKIVHCTYLLVGAELGLPGLALFLAMMAAFFRIGIRGIKSPDPFISNISAALVTAMMAFAIAILPSPDYRILYVKNHIWMIWGLTLVTAKLDYHMKKLRKKKNVVQKRKSLVGLPVKKTASPATNYTPPLPNFGPGSRL